MISGDSENKNKKKGLTHTPRNRDTSIQKSHRKTQRATTPENFAPENFNFWVRPQPLLPNDFFFFRRKTIYTIKAF